LFTIISTFRSQADKPISGLKEIFEISVMNTLWSIIASEKHSFGDEKALYMHKVCYE
jgi:hypothetical protein